MNKAIIISGKRRVLSTVFAVVMMVAISAPSIPFYSPIIASAQEAGSEASGSDTSASASTESESAPAESTASATPTTETTTPESTSTTEVTPTISATDSTNTTTTPATETRVTETEVGSTTVDTNSADDSSAQTGANDENSSQENLSTTGTGVFNYDINLGRVWVNGRGVDIGGSAGGSPFVGTLDQHFVQINWGDGMIENATRTDFQRTGAPIFRTMAGPWDATHVYAADGVYTISVFIYHQNPNGTERSEVETRQITIGNPPPPPPTEMGSIRFCVVIADQNGNVATTRENLPASAFQINLRDAADNRFIASSTTMYASNWTTNATVGGLRSNCTTFANLPVNATGYHYSELHKFNLVQSYWNAPKYNDQFNREVTGLDTFWDYSPELWDNDPSNDAQRNEDTDGHIVLTSARPDRTLVVLNRYNAPITDHCLASDNIMSADEYWNAHFTFVPGSTSQYLIQTNILGMPTVGRLPADATQATFQVINRTNCIIPMSAASYKVFDDVNTRIDTQVQIDTTGLVNVQPNTTENLVVDLATCKTQVDGWYGLAPVSFSNPNRSTYLYPNVPFQLYPAALTLSDYCDNGPGPTNNPPVITVLGTNPMTVVVNTTFTDPGATASDPEDGDITSRIVTTGTVNTAVIGSYTITYTVADNQGLTDTEVRTVHVVSSNPNPGTPCFMPDSLGDSGAETIEANNETSVQTMLNNAGFSINAATEQQSYQTWRSSQGPMTVEAQFIDSISALGNVFGYYTNNDLSTFQPLFRAGDNTQYPSVPEINRGSTVQFTLPANQDIGFAIHAQYPDGQGTFRATRNSLNESGNDHALVYNAPSSNNFIIAFEDATISLSDHDYNDMVARVQVTRCSPDSTNQNNPPEITVLGSNPMTVHLHSTFNDPGATAHDPEEGDITSRIVTTGTVDASTLGSYTITYTVADNRGLTDTEVRTVNVVINDGTGGGGGDDDDDNRRRRGGSRRSTSSEPEGQILGASTGPSCEYLKDYLRRDWNNDRAEMLKLQYFLKFSQGFGNLETTGVFDNATFAAVSEFQARYNDDILNPWGYSDDESTGFVYILTKKKINEIACSTELSLSSFELEEIEQFRSYITGLKAAGINVAFGNSSFGSTEVVKDNSTDDVSFTPSSGTKVSFTPTSSTTTSLISLGTDDEDNSRMDLSNLRNVAGAIFSIPKDRGMLLQSLYFLLIAIIAVYLFTEIIIGSRDTSKLSKYQVWARKATIYTIGLVLAIVAAIYYQIFSIIIPLLILAIASAAFLIWAMTKRNSAGSVINLPPKANR